MQPSRAAFNALAIAGCIALAACGRSEPEQPNLLLVVVDTLRQDHLGCYGYDNRSTSPALDRFCEDAVRLEGLTCVSSWTKPSMATLFTGLTPAGHGLSQLFDVLTEPLTLAQHLSDNGYDTACVMSNFLLGHDSQQESSGFQRGFDLYDDEICGREKIHKAVTSEEVADRGLHWLEQREDGDPWFLVLHFFDPHVIYVDRPEFGFLEEGDYQGWVRPGMKREEFRVHQENCSLEDVARLEAVYDGEVRAVDEAFGRVLEALKQREDWEDTVVVFTTDHGEELGERSYIGHTTTLHEEIIALPLVIRFAGDLFGGEVRRVRLSQVDLFATLADICGTRVPEGRGDPFTKILRGEEPEKERPCFSEVHYDPVVEARTEKITWKRSLVRGNYKLIHDMHADELHLYDLSKDPGERTNLAGQIDFDGIEKRLIREMGRNEWLMQAAVDKKFRVPR